MFEPATDRDLEIAREYIVLRSARKAIEHDKQAMKYRSALRLSEVYVAIINDAQERIDRRIKTLQRELIRIAKTEVAGVYEVRIANRKGDLLLDSTEIRMEAERFILGDK